MKTMAATVGGLRGGVPARAAEQRAARRVSAEARRAGRRAKVVAPRMAVLLVRATRGTRAGAPVPTRARGALGATSCLWTRVLGIPRSHCELRNRIPPGVS